MGETTGKAEGGGAKTKNAQKMKLRRIKYEPTNIRKYQMKAYSKKPMEPDISSVIAKIKDIGGAKIRFILLYGSAAKGENTTLSDIDIAVYYDGDKRERFDFRVKILGRVSSKFDIQTFQDLPLYVQNEILSTGKVLDYNNYKDIFNIFMKTIREFEDFKPRLELYYSSMGV